MIKIFGVSYQADSYYLATSIIGSLGLISFMFIEQFLYFYNDVKVNNIDSSKQFYYTVITYTIIFQLIFFIFLNSKMESIISIFSFGVDKERFNLIKIILHIQSIAFFLTPIIQVNNWLFNAEMKFIFPYITQIMLTLSNTFALSYIFLEKNKDIVLISYFSVGFNFLVIIIQNIVLNKNKINFKLSFKHPYFKKFIINSFTMRIGHNIHNFLLTPIITNTLSLLPTGSVASYSYADRIMNINKSLVIGPSFNMFQSKISLLLSEKKYEEIKSIIFNFLKVSISLLLFSSCIIYFIVPILMDFFSQNSISKSNSNQIQNVFILLSIWTLIVTYESSFVQLLIASKNSKIFIIGNSIFICVFSLFILILRDYLGIYVIPVSMILAQFFNNYIYISEALKVLKFKNKTI
ncbi:MAG: lipid II flippase MurJ [Candidatus Sericytochromatia bacterium]